MSEQKHKLLEVKDLKVSFFTPAGEVKAVGGISYDLDYGEVMGVVGESGSGKSTMLNMIAGVYPIDSGKIEIDGVNISREPEYKRAQYIGRVFQDPMTGTAATMNIEENMALAERDGHDLVDLLADALDLIERRAGRDERERAALDLFKCFLAKRKAEAVDGDDGQPLGRYLEQRAHVHGARLVRRNGEARLLDHGLERLFGDLDGVLLLDLGQLGEIGGGEAHDVEIRVAAGQVDQKFVVRGEGHDVVGQSS